MATTTQKRELKVAGEGVRDLAPTQFLTAAQVAQAFQVCVATIWRAARRGELSPTRVGRAWRFHPSVLEQPMPQPALTRTVKHLRRLEGL